MVQITQIQALVGVTNCRIAGNAQVATPPGHIN